MKNRVAYKKMCISSLSVCVCVCVYYKDKDNEVVVGQIFVGTVQIFVIFAIIWVFFQEIRKFS